MIEISGMTAVVTGAAGCLGASVVGALEACGVHCVCVDRTTERLHDVLGAPTPTRSYAAASDLSDSREVSALVNDLRARVDGIHALIHTVGAYRAGSPLHETTDDDLELLLDANLRATFVTLRGFTPGLIASGRGSIVTIGARDAAAPTPGAGAYSATKAGVLRLTEAVALESGHLGLRANCIMPGPLDTPGNRDAIPPEIDLIPARAIADLIVFLLSDSGRAINGAAISVVASPLPSSRRLENASAYATR